MKEKGDKMKRNYIIKMKEGSEIEVRELHTQNKKEMKERR